MSGRSTSKSRIDDGVLRLHLNRPDKRNAIDDSMVAAMIDSVDAAGRDEAVRAIVLSGEGDHFCSGFDIVSRNAEDGTGRGSGASSGACRRRPTG